MSPTRSPRRRPFTPTFRRSLALLALVAALCMAVAVHHEGRWDMDMHDAPAMVLCLGLAATTALIGLVPPRATRWGAPIDQRPPGTAVPTVPVPSPSRDGPPVLQVFLN